MPMRSALVALACSRLGLAASAAANWAVDDSSALLQRFAEEESPEGPHWPHGPRFRVVPYKEVWEDSLKQFSDMIPPAAKKRKRAEMDSAAKAVMASATKATESAMVAMEKLEAGQKIVEKSLNNKRKELLASRPRLWRKEKNSTEYGLVDGYIEATRARLQAKERIRNQKAARKLSELGRNMISAMPQPMMPGFTPVVPVADPGAPTPMTADEMAGVVENYRKRQRDMAQKKGRVDEEKQEEVWNNKEDDKEDEQELSADRAKEAATAAEQREQKRRADTLARQAARQAARQRRKQEQDDAFPKHLFEEGVE